MTDNSYTLVQTVKRRDSRVSLKPVATVDSLSTYMNQISQVELLTAAQEIDLAIKIDVGGKAADTLKEAQENNTELSRKELRKLNRLIESGEEAKKQFIEANLRLVVSVAKNYLGRGLDFVDLIQEGNIGLMKAVEKFDYKKGFKFSTYATWWIRQGVQRGLADKGRTVRIPAHAHEKFIKFSRIETNLRQELGREPTIEEISEEAGISADKYQEFKKAFMRPISLDAPVGEDGDKDYGDYIEDPLAVLPEKNADYMTLKSLISDVLTQMEPREAHVLSLRFGLLDGEKHTLDEIGKIFGVTHERIRKIEGKAITNFKIISRNQGLEDFLGD